MKSLKMSRSLTPQTARTPAAERRKNAAHGQALGQQHRAQQAPAGAKETWSSDTLGRGPRAPANMASFYRSTVEEFLAQTEEHVLARLAIGYANRGYTSQYSDQTLTWERDINSLRRTLQQCVMGSDSAKTWGMLLEFSIPRKELRIDVVFLIQDIIVVLEAKTGSAVAQAKRQIEEYSLLLHYFHQASAELRIVPIVVSPEADEVELATLNQAEFRPQFSTYWLSDVVRSSWQGLSKVLLALENLSAVQKSVETWDNSPYFPVPNILEAAVALRSGLAIREIAHSEASGDEIENVRQAVQGYVESALTRKRHAICFLTGVPGSGKTLVGLGLAHSDENKTHAIHFMSGNGPLVQVLQHLFTRTSMRSGAKAVQARAEAKTLIENIHVFARYHTEDNPGPPSNHAIIFDEAQRAWSTGIYPTKPTFVRAFGARCSQQNLRFKVWSWTGSASAGAAISFGTSRKVGSCAPCAMGGKPSGAG
jgi:hypothetical protein